jgi:acetaldehyde dehydrogenase/alcohol dehydrogenase
MYMMCAQVIKLIEAVEGLKAQLDVPPTIRQVMNKAGSAELDAAYLDSTLEMAYQAFDDQCTGANPRYPVRCNVRLLIADPEFVARCV